MWWTGAPRLHRCTVSRFDVDHGCSVLYKLHAQQDHLPFWHFPPLAAGTGFGQGTGDIIEYMASLKPSQYAKPFGWMVWPVSTGTLRCDVCCRIPTFSRRCSGRP